MFCDIRITSADSKLGANFVKLGINPGMGGTFTMPLKVPSQVSSQSSPAVSQPLPWTSPPAKLVTSQAPKGNTQSPALKAKRQVLP